GQREHRRGDQAERDSSVHSPASVGSLIQSARRGGARPRHVALDILEIGHWPIFKLSLSTCPGARGVAATIDATRVRFKQIGSCRGPASRGARPQGPAAYLEVLAEPRMPDVSRRLTSGIAEYSWIPIAVAGTIARERNGR